MQTIEDKEFKKFRNDGNDTLVAVSDFESVLHVAMGDVVGTSSVNKFGENDDIDKASVPEVICDCGGVYTFSTIADIDSISGNNAADTMEIVVQGLDADWLEVSQSVTLTGQTRVALTTPLIRVYRAYNNSSTDLVGDVFIYVDTAITGGEPIDSTKKRASILARNNQTMMCIYTIPADKVGYMLSSYASLANTKVTGAKMRMMGRPFGGVFRTMAATSLNSTGNSSFVRTPAIPRKIGPKTDILMQCDEVTADGTAIAGGFDIILKDI